MEPGIVYKSVSDLGAAAYIMMHKYKAVGRQGKDIFFEVNEGEENDFDALAMDYLNSEFHRFDSSLMSLKKMGNWMPKK